MIDAFFAAFVLWISVFSISYFFVVNGTYITLTSIAVRSLIDQRTKDAHQPAGIVQSNDFLPKISIIVPAYNEETVIVESIESLLSLEYPYFDIIVVNDGSTDETVTALKEAYSLSPIEADFPISLPCEPILQIYRSEEQDIILIDKENGGKADSLNAGVFFTDQPLYCAIDADSLIERGALIDVVEPFLRNPTETVATGGSVRIVNDVSFSKGRPSTVRLPTNRLVRFQVVEYLRAFFLGRTGLSQIGSLLIISGAFGLFKTEVVREIGGYDTTSITEDMELVVRLHRHLIDTKQPYDVSFVPHPVVWTEAPESLTLLSRQRRRWFRGLLDTLSKHRGAIGRRRYGTIGLIALPLFLFIESLGRLVEGLGYLLLPLFFLTGIVDLPFFFAFFLVAIGLGSFLTVFAVFSEVITYRRYERPRDIAILLWYSTIESITFRPWRAFIAWRATIEYFRGNTSWGSMTRTGFSKETDE